MDISKSFTYAFKDKSWPGKLGLLLVVLIVPILSLAGMGYSLEITRRVMKGSPRPLPEWDRLGRKWLDGLVLDLAFLAYSLPALLLASVPVILFAAPGLLSGQDSLAVFTDLVERTGSVAFVAVGVAAGLYGLAVSFLYPAIFIRFAQVGTFGSCFGLKQIFALIGRGRGRYFTAWAVLLGISFGVGLVGGALSWVPCLGQIVAIAAGLVALVYSPVVAAHLFGQVGAGSPSRGSGRPAAASRRGSKTKARSPAKGRRTARTSGTAKRKPAAASKTRRKAGGSAASRRKPAGSGRSRRR
jgi:hypothetical protein